MGLNRMMMKNGEDLKNIKAMMTVGSTSSTYGFENKTIRTGSLSPNPLPNGVLVILCSTTRGYVSLKPSSIKSCTINNITVRNDERNNTLDSYLRQKCQQNNSRHFPF